MTQPDPGASTPDRTSSAAGREEPGSYAVRLERATRGLLEVNVAVLSRMEGKINPSHLRALQELDRLGGAKVSELAEALGVLPSTASRISDRLSDAGLLTRRIARDNRRATWLETTVSGRAILTELEHARTAALDRIAARMAPAERDALLNGAEAFAHAYTQDRVNP